MRAESNRDAAQLATEITADYLSSLSVKVRELAGGSVNHVFQTESDETSLVVRLPKLDDVWRGTVFFEKEEWCLRQAIAVKIPSPTPLKIGHWKGRPYMLQRFITGAIGTECCLAECSLWRTLGEYARRIHRVQLDGLGETLAEFKSGAESGWRKLVEYNLNSLTAADELRHASPGFGLDESISPGQPGDHRRRPVALPSHVK